MPSSLPAARPGEDPLKRWGWVLLLAPLLVMAGLIAPILGPAEDEEAASSDALAATEQSLRSLDPAENPQGSPGSPIGRGFGTGAAPAPEAAAARPAAAGRGGRSAPEREAGAAAPGAELALALSRAAAGGKAVVKTPGSDSWGGREPRTGLTRPAFARMASLSDAQGGGGASGAFSAVSAPFGRGGDPGFIDRGAGGGRSPGRAGPGGSRSLEELRQVQKVSAGALAGGSEVAAGYGRKAFEGSALRQGLAGTQSFDGSGLVEGETPVNLKANDPRINAREFEPPAVGAPKTVEPEERQSMEQQLMMMLLTVAVGGVLGPAFSAVGSALVSGLLTKPPKADGGSGVGEQIGRGAGTAPTRGP